MKGTLLSAIMVLLVLSLAGFVSAAGLPGGFDITDITVDNDEVKPGESFTVEVEVTNNLTNQAMEDIEVEVVVLNIDDGDDLDDSSEMDDIDEGDDDKIEFEFTVPYAVDDQDYDIEITVTGSAENGTDYETKANATVKVEKDKHELIMKQPTVSQETVKCSRSVQVSEVLYNIGTKDEEVELSVYNSDLDIEQKQTFDLDSGNDEDDMKATKIFNLDLKNVEAGTYTFYVKASYDDNNEQETESFSIKVEDCPTTKPATTTTTTPTTPTTTPVATTPAVTTSPIVSVPAIVEEESFMDQYGSLVLLGLAYIIVIVVGVILVVSLLKKR